MNELTDDLRDLVLTRQITKSQARGMMASPRRNENIAAGKRSGGGCNFGVTKAKSAFYDEPEQSLCVNARGTGTGKVSNLPDDVYAILLSFCSFESLVGFGSSCKFLSYLALNDSLWERLYLQRWKRPKPPSSGANCPRYHLTFYQLYTRRIILGCLRGDFVSSELVLPVKKMTIRERIASNQHGDGNGTSSLRVKGNHDCNKRAIVAVRNVGDEHIVSAGIDGLIKSWDLSTLKCVSSLDAKDAFTHHDRELALEKRVQSLDQAWKNKLMTFKVSNISPKVNDEGTLDAEKTSVKVEIDIWGSVVDGNETIDGGLNDSNSSSAIKIPGHALSPSGNFNVSMTTTSDHGISSDWSSESSDNDSDLCGSSSEATQFCVGRLGTSPGVGGFLHGLPDNKSYGFTKTKRRESKKIEKHLKKEAAKEARINSMKAKALAKERKKMERQQSKTKQTYCSRSSHSPVNCPSVFFNLGLQGKELPRTNPYSASQSLNMRMSPNGSPHKLLLSSSPIEVGTPPKSELAFAQSAFSPSTGYPESPSSNHLASAQLCSPVSPNSEKKKGLKEKVKLKKNRKHRNSWQQSRDDRAKKLKESIEERKLARSAGSDVSPADSGSDAELHLVDDLNEAGNINIKCPIVYVSRGRGAKVTNCGTLPLKDQGKFQNMNPRIIAVFHDSHVVTFTAPLINSANDRSDSMNEKKMMNEIVLPRVLSRPTWLRSDQWVIQCVALTFDGKIVLGHSGDGQLGTAFLTVWDASSGKQLHTLYGIKGAPSCLVAFECSIIGDSSASHIVSGDAAGDVSIWNVSAGIFEEVLQGGVIIDQSQFARNGRLVSTLKGLVSRVDDIRIVTVVAGYASGNVVVWHGESKGSSQELLFIPRGVFTDGSASAAVVRAIAVASWQRPYVRMIAFGGDDCAVNLWELPLIENGRESAAVWNARSSSKGWKKVLRGHDGAISAVKIDLAKVTSASMDGTVKLWEVVGKHAGRCLRTLRHPSATKARPIPALSLQVGSLSVTVGYLDGSLHMFSFGKKNKNHLVGTDQETVIQSFSNRKGGSSPQRNSLTTKKFASGGKRRGRRDLQALAKRSSRYGNQ